jgi:hypothetical protein
VTYSDCYFGGGKAQLVNSSNAVAASQEILDITGLFFSPFAARVMLYEHAMQIRAEVRAYGRHGPEGLVNLGLGCRALHLTHFDSYSMHPTKLR